MGSARVLSGGSSVHDHARPSARDAAALAYPSGTANCANLPTKTDKGGDSLASTFVIGLAGFLSVQRAHNGESLAPALSLRARVAVVDQGSHKGGQTQRRCGICGFRVTHSGVATSLVAVCSSGPDRKSTIEALIRRSKR